MYIAMDPALSFSDLWSLSKPVKNSECFCIGKNSTVFFYSHGRQAIADAMTMLDVQPGQKVLMPAYVCDVAVIPLLKMKIGIEFYSVDGGLGVDLNELEKKLDAKTRALFIVHYFGFMQPMQPIREFCDQKALFLIEDAAHSFLSGYGREKFCWLGDAVILSMRKSVPILAGASLILSRRIVSDSNIFALRLSQTYVFKQLLHSLLDNFEMRISRSVIRHHRWLLLENNHQTVTEQATPDPQFSDRHAMPTISKRLLQSMNFPEIIRRRRENFKFLSERLRHVSQLQTIFADLPEGVCPWEFPMRSAFSDSAKICKALNRLGVPAFRWPKLPTAVLTGKGRIFEQACEYASRTILLPIHQSMSGRHLEYIAKRVHEVF